MLNIFLIQKWPGCLDIRGENMQVYKLLKVIRNRNGSYSFQNTRWHRETNLRDPLGQEQTYKNRKARSIGT